jgi:hypothetical protein
MVLLDTGVQYVSAKLLKRLFLQVCRVFPARRFFEVLRFPAISHGLFSCERFQGRQIPSDFQRRFLPGEQHFPSSVAFSLFISQWWFFLAAVSSVAYSQRQFPSDFPAAVSERFLPRTTFHVGKNQLRTCCTKRES